MNSDTDNKEPKTPGDEPSDVSVPTLTKEAVTADKQPESDDKIVRSETIDPKLDQPEQDKPDIDKSTVKPTAAAQPKKPSRAGIVLSVIALLISFGLIAAAAYGVYWIKPFYQQWQLTISDRDSLTDQVQTLKADILLNQTTIQQQHKANQQLKLRLNDSAALLNDQQAQINSLRHTDRSDWQLAEVEYLCRLANQRLMSDRNAFVAMNLLLEADTILKDMQRADLFAVRTQLAEDIQALRGVNRNDVAGSLIQLQSLGAAVKHLQFLPEKQLGSTQLYQSSNSSANENTFYAVLGALKDLYRVQPIKEPPEPVLALDQIAILKQQVTLRLAQAEYALMQGDNTLYQQSLGFAVNAVQQYAAKSANKAVFLEQLAILQAFELTPEMPNITGSHTVVYEYVQKRRAHPDAVTTP